MLLKLPDGSEEHFNVVVFYVSDVIHLQEVLGRVSCNARYGCYLCTKENTVWAAKSVTRSADSLSMTYMRQAGSEALAKLGESPKDGSKEYTLFHQAHFGQIAPPLLSCVEGITMPPCGLHLTLAIHRFFWKVG